MNNREQEKTAMPGKLIVCLSKSSEQGKSETIKALAELLMPDPPKANVHWLVPRFPHAENGGMPTEITGDICVAVDVRGKRVGLSSCGDFFDVIHKELKFLKEKECDVIFCACRSRGYTVETVMEMAEGYTLIWTDPYTHHKPPPGMKEQEWQRCLNRKKAEHLADFI